MTEIPNKARMMFVTANLKGNDNNNKRINLIYRFSLATNGGADSFCSTGEDILKTNNEARTKYPIQFILQC